MKTSKQQLGGWILSDAARLITEDNCVSFLIEDNGIIFGSALGMAFVGMIGNPEKALQKWRTLVSEPKHRGEEELLACKLLRISLETYKQIDYLHGEVKLPAEKIARILIEDRKD